MNKTTPIQVPLKLHKALNKDLIEYDKIKTFAGLISYYRALARKYLKKLNLEEKNHA